MLAASLIPFGKITIAVFVEGGKAFIFQSFFNLKRLFEKMKTVNFGPRLNNL